MPAAKGRCPLEDSRGLAGQPAGTPTTWTTAMALLVTLMFSACDSEERRQLQREAGELHTELVELQAKVQRARQTLEEVEEALDSVQSSLDDLESATADLGLVLLRDVGPRIIDAADDIDSYLARAKSELEDAQRELD
jgi:cell division protein ZapA (FtsZ GTPase activity inhibitor)